MFQTSIMCCFPKEEADKGPVARTTPRGSLVGGDLSLKRRMSKERSESKDSIRARETVPHFDLSFPERVFRKASLEIFDEGLPKSSAKGALSLSLFFFLKKKSANDTLGEPLVLQ